MKTRPTPPSEEWQQRDAVWSCGLPKREKFTLLAVLDFDRRAKGTVLFPSLDRVARMTGLSYNSVCGAMRALKRLGILEEVARVNSQYGLRGRVAQFRFHRERLPRSIDVPRDTTKPLEAVEPDSCKLVVAVESTTATNSEPDTCQLSARQLQATDDDRTYERTNDRKEHRADAGCARQEDHDPEQQRGLQQGQPQGALDEPTVAIKHNGSIRHRHHALSREPAPDGNYRVAVQLAHVVMTETELHEPTDPSLIEAFTMKCADARLHGRIAPVVDADLVQRALNAAFMQHIVGVKA